MPNVKKRAVCSSEMCSLWLACCMHVSKHHQNPTTNGNVELRRAFHSKAADARKARD